MSFCWQRIYQAWSIRTNTDKFTAFSTACAQEVHYFVHKCFYRYWRKDTLDYLYSGDVVARKGIQVNFQHNLIEVKPDEKEAVFALLGDSPDKQETTTVKVETATAVRWLQY